MREVQLRWLGPFSLKQIVSREELPSEFQGQGVYVWVNTSHRRIAYVGKAASVSLWKRQFDWYWAGISGQALIPGEIPKDPWWVPERNLVAATITDEEQYLSLVRKAFRYMSNYDVYVAGVQATDIVSKIEQLLLFALQPDDTTYPVHEPRSDLVFVHENPPWRDSDLASQVRLLSNEHVPQR